MGLSSRQHRIGWTYTFGIAALWMQVLCMCMCTHIHGTAYTHTWCIHKHKYSHTLLRLHLCILLWGRYSSLLQFKSYTSLNVLFHSSQTNGPWELAHKYILFGVQWVFCLFYFVWFLMVLNVRHSNLYYLSGSQRHVNLQQYTFFSETWSNKRYELFSSVGRGLLEVICK